MVFMEPTMERLDEPGIDAAARVILLQPTHLPTPAVLFAERRSPGANPSYFMPSGGEAYGACRSRTPAPYGPVWVCEYLPGSAWTHARTSQHRRTIADESPKRSTSEFLNSRNV